MSNNNNKNNNNKNNNDLKKWILSAFKQRDHKEITCRDFETP